MTFHPTDCQMLSLYISHILQFHISNCCCSGVHEMHLGILLRRSETDCLAIAVPSLAFKAMSPQCLLNLFSVTSGSGSLSSTYSPSSAFVINLFSLLVNSHPSLVSDHHFSSSSLSVNSCRSLCCFFPGQEQLVAGLAQCPRSLPANCRLLHIISPQVALPPCYT